ncbi:MAG: LuxR C-terminal-related transcriptional regulator [Sulfuricaulis sp.]|nr:LuxR C-terminal-related transcriptional regulator [Sulfuricaulis sp.]
MSPLNFPASFQSRNETGLVRSKLVAPLLGGRILARDGVAEWLQRCATARLIVFRAPAGFGKTTAMRQYYGDVQARGKATAWLTLDPLDDDFRRLTTHLLAAVDLVLRWQPGVEGLPIIGPTPKDFDAQALNMMSRISNAPHPFTLFIDEYETVENRAIDDVMRLLVDRLPPHGQIAIASRQTPDLQLGRLRSKGWLIEIDQQRLRFTRRETDQFLRQAHGLALSAADIDKLHDDTEGWPATLTLAAAALDGRLQPQSFIASFSGTQTAVAEYLADDVLSRQPDEVRSFLLDTSVLIELNASLCDAVCQRGDSAVVLTKLERAHLCELVSDNEPRSYRYHGLVKSFLRSQLEQMQGGAISGLHQRAAQWYLAQGRVYRGIEHALSAGCTEDALDLICAQANPLLFEGRFRLLISWLHRIPVDVLQARLELRIAQIWALALTGRSLEALRLLEDLPAEVVARPLPGALESERLVLRAVILSYLDRAEEAYALAEQVLLYRPPADRFAHHVLAAGLADWRVANNRYDDAIAVLKDASPRQEHGQGTVGTIMAICVEGLVDLVQNRVRQATSQFRVAVYQAAADFGSRSIGKSSAAVFLAQALYELDELDEAEQLLTIYQPFLLEYALPDQVIVSYVIQARIALIRGDADHALRRLSELEFFGRRAGLARLVACAQIERARMALLNGDLAEARRRVNRAEDPQAWMGTKDMVPLANDVESLMLARYRLAMHGIERGSALTAIKQDIRTARKMLRARRALKLELIHAHLLESVGEHRTAMRTLRDVLQVAAVDGLMRTVLDEGAPMIELVRSFRASMPAFNQSEADRTLSSFLDRLLRRAGVVVKLEEGSVGPETVPALTPRELEILSWVSNGLTNDAIASSLFVSETTVRAHLRNVSAKLGASNRTQAVGIARRLGLLG